MTHSDSTADKDAVTTDPSAVEEQIDFVTDAVTEALIECGADDTTVATVQEAGEELAQAVSGLSEGDNL